MREFAKLLDKLYFTHGNLEKAIILKDYLQHTTDPDRGYALGIIAGTLNFNFFKRNLIISLISERVDLVLYEMSYDYVGETAETVAHLWPASPDMVRLNRVPSLSEIVENFSNANKEEVKDYLRLLLDNMLPSERWALIKLGTGNLRIGLSARTAKQVLADYGGVDVHEIEEIWHGLEPPYEDLFAWLEKRGEKPKQTAKHNYIPVMLSHPLEEADIGKISHEEFAAEWKYDGIRVQIISDGTNTTLFSRSGDNISEAFPDLVSKIKFNAVLDGELLVRHGSGIASFNDLQQRLNRKKPSKKMVDDYPAYVIIYDTLFLEGEDIRMNSYSERRMKLIEWWRKQQINYMEISEPLEFKSNEELDNLRKQADRIDIPHIEGLMLKRKESAYVTGRPKGLWYKWKRNPLVIDAVMMYAQRGHGKRSSFYSDFTFGCWKDGVLLPVGKAYSGFTDEELKEIDKWVRHNTTERFGPVREVKKEKVFELAFDSVQRSTRHKSGLSLRFPRVHRLRWDKPASEADQLETLEKMI